MADAARAVGGPIDLSNEGPYTLDEESVRINALAARIGGYTSVDKLLLRSNCNNVSEVISLLNEGMSRPEVASPIGKLVPESRIGFISKNGVTTVCGQGRWALWSIRAEWVCQKSLRDCPITVGPITIFRVQAGHYGKVIIGNDPFLVSPENGGLYATHDPAFRYEGSVPIDEQYIRHGTIHIIRVPKGSYGCVKQNNVPALLPPGIHTFNTADFKLEKFASLSDKDITFETITRFYVPTGSIGIAWRDSQPIFFQDRGVYLVDSPMFQFREAVPIETPAIVHGSKKIITVMEGLVGVSHFKGQLQILPPGRHLIDNEEHIFDEFLSTQQQSLTLTKDDSRDSLMVCESRELVRLGIQASVFYNIREPKLAVVKIGERRQIENFINDTATAVITTIIRTTSLAEIAQSGKATSGGGAATLDEMPAERQASKADADGDEDFAPNLPFFDRMHADFIGRLQNSFLRDYGIFMLSIRIGDFKVLDTDIAQSIANHAATTAATQAKLANLEGNRQIDLVKKDSEARVERIQADVDAHRMTTQSRAQAAAMRDQAQAKADTMKIEAAARMEATKLEAEAKAQSIRVIAEAEAQATRAKGEAEAARAAKIGDIPFGREVTLAEVQARMVEKSIAGVEKVVYLPSDMQRNPFALFSQDSLAKAATLAGQK